MRARIFIVLLMLSLAFRADAQALPAFTGLVNKTLGKVIEKTAIRRGFAANDPRMFATFSGASTVAAGIAADVAVAAATAASAPVWLSVAAGLGAAAAVGGLAYGIYKVFFDDSSSEAKFVVRETGGRTPGAPWDPGANPYTYLQPGLTFDADGTATNSTKDRIPQGVFGYFGIYVYCDDPIQCMQLGVQGWINIGGGTGAKFMGCDPETPIGGFGAGNVTCHSIRIGTGGNSQPDSQWINGDSVFVMVKNPYKPAATYKGKIGNIVSQLSTAELERPADASTMATLANDLWQQAASQPGYQGLPYSPTNPVTTADAVAVQQSDPATWPTNADLVSPVAPGAGQVVVINPAYDPVTNPSPGTGTDPNTSPGGTQNVNVVNTPNVNVVNQVKIDWGSDPGVPSLSLEATPTAQSILRPVFNVMPTLRNFVVPAHSSECPKPTFNLFNKAILMDTHCTVLDGVRPTLYAVMAFVWLMLGALIILRA